MRKLDSVIGFTSVAKSLEEIKDALQREDYVTLARHFDMSRRLLIDARESHPRLTDEQKRSIQKALAFLKTLEVEVRTGKADSIKLQHPKFVKTILEISDSVTAIVITTKNMDFST